MIIKELDPFIASGAHKTTARIQSAGREAEEQMAFYLRRAFGEKKDIYVINGLRLERNGGGHEGSGIGAAQIDHLIVHRGGMIIVESKSVHGCVRVNDHGEWARVYRGSEQGIPSPMEQARRQAEFLTRFLNENAPQLAGKLLGLVQAYFGALSIEVLVAISDSGIIDRPKKLPLPEVCKADQIPAKIQEVIERQRRATGLFTGALSLNTGRGLTRTELENILASLPAAHRARPTAEARLLAATTIPEPVPAWTVPIQQAETEPAAQITQAIAVLEQTSGQEAVPLDNEGDSICAFCGKSLSPKVVQFCRDNADRLSGMLYCFEHQRASRRRHPVVGI